MSLRADAVALGHDVHPETGRCVGCGLHEHDLYLAHRMPACGTPTLTPAKLPAATPGRMFKCTCDLDGCDACDLSGWLLA